MKLLAQHQRLRDLLGQARALGRRFQGGPAAARALAHCLVALRGAFEEHNQLELSLLEPLLRDDQAWGPARIARMREEHGAEHAVIAETLAGGVVEVVARLDDFAEEMEAHMDAEERTFLSPAVLGNDPSHAALRKRLELRRRDLLIRHQHTRELADEDLATHEIELADNAAALWDARLLATIGEVDRRALAAVTAALRRLDEGRYGRCVVCAAEIDADRLAALPEAERCLACADLG